MADDGPPFQLFVQVVRGRDLAAKDKRGTSDPYIVVKYNGRLCKTNYVKKSLNPVWNETFSFDVGPPGCAVDIECWDKDQIGSDDFMGQFCVETAGLQPRAKYVSTWHELKSRSDGEKGEMISGAIELMMSLQEAPQIMAAPTESARMCSSSAIDARACGQVFLRPEGWFNFFWKRLWILLRDGELTLRRSYTDPDPVETHGLAAITASQSLPGVPSIGKKAFRDCYFDVSIGKRVLHFRAGSPAERDVWARQLQRALAGPPPQPPPPPPPKAYVPSGDVFFVPARGWVDETPQPNAHSFVSLENSEVDVLWYQRHFIGREHFNYIGQDDKRASVVVSTIRESWNHTELLRGVVWTRHGCLRVLFEAPKVQKPRTDLTAVLKAADPELAKSLTKMKNASGDFIRRCLVDLEAQELPKKFKFGVLYARDGQTKEEDMFGNDCDPATDTAYATFLNQLGKRITLQGWEGFKAGLDVTANGTGTHSIFTEHRGNDIMFHVSTMLPHDREDSGQHVQRKRQIGNDVVCIVFMNGKTPFDPTCIQCQFLHIFAVVRPADTPGKYSVGFVRQTTVAPFGPPLTETTVDGGAHFVDFLLTKLVNGERSALRSSQNFWSQTARAREQILTNIVDSFKADKFDKNKSLPTLPGAMPDLTPLRGERATISSAPVSDLIYHRNTLIDGFPRGARCLEFWGENFAFSNDSGLYVHALSGDVLFVSPMAMEQVAVEEREGILVGRSLRNGALQVFFVDSIGPWERLLVPGTKGSHAFNLFRSDDKLYLSCVIGRVIIFFEWRKTLFIRLPDKRFVVPNVPRVVVAEGLTTYCCSATEVTQVNFDGTSRELMMFGSRVEPASVLAAEDGCHWITYDDVSVLVDNAGAKRSTIRWSVTPVHCILRSPYLIAFSPIHIEIRSTINSALLQVLNFAHAVRFLAHKPTESDALYINVSPTLASLTLVQLSASPFIPTWAKNVAESRSVNMAQAGANDLAQALEDFKSTSKQVKAEDNKALGNLVTELTALVAIAVDEDERSDLETMEAMCGYGPLMVRILTAAVPADRRTTLRGINFHSDGMVGKMNVVTTHLQAAEKALPDAAKVSSAIDAVVAATADIERISARLVERSDHEAWTQNVKRAQETVEAQRTALRDSCTALSAEAGEDKVAAVRAAVAALSKGVLDVHIQSLREAAGLDLDTLQSTIQRLAGEIEGEAAEFATAAGTLTEYVSRVASE